VHQHQTQVRDIERAVAELSQFADPNLRKGNALNAIQTAEFVLGVSR
jgi:hypothetical protein